MPRKQNEITQIRRKITRGEPVTPDERAKVTAYYARQTRKKKGVHLKGDREQRWQELADRQGTSMSSWIQERVESDLAGAGDVERELRQEISKLRDELIATRGTNGHYAVENSKLHARLEALENSLMEAMDQALRLRDGAP